MLENSYMKATLLFLFLFSNLAISSTDPLKNIELITPSSDVVRTSLAYKSADIIRGLSGMKPDDFNADQGKFFFYFSNDWRTFWMRETFFNLDIIYLDPNLKIIRIVRDMPFYEGRQYNRIPRAPSIKSRHVLEMKASSEISARLNVGDQLIWKSSLSMKRTAQLMWQRL